MGQFIIKRVGVMLLTAACLTFIVFFLTNLYPNLEKLAKTQGNNRMSDAEVASWLDKHGYNQSTVKKYGEWLGVVPSRKFTTESGTTYTRCSRPDIRPEDAPDYCGLLQGNWGYSSVFKEEVSGIVSKRLGLTGYLMGAVLMVMIPMALIIGVVAGMREGTRTDRTLSTFAIATTATPEYVSGILFIVIFASSKMGLSPLFAEWGLIDSRTILKGSATSAMVDITFVNFTLPVMALALYGMGYIARMTRASMAEVMTAQYIRTARLKGVSFYNIVVKHALRNALIAPFTVIMLQIPWLLTGVVIVETMFNYKGFGWALVQAASNNDIELLLGISVVAVVVVLITQLISDIGYVFLNPRIRVN
ncbi:ABC transporter permease [Candidatus Halocynthiibacter alkanivorans]|jgi:peptide/nickel transport system permease protein|uniref:ABC transporter permease n=1 Tax=Candidatus Halocynthiibacter alkanivorans TaxID=2267619 RepID=UPI000DF1FF83|nr:ABC transporter permease [Candidatus Halocynthiibacter alkanivorans]